MLKGQEKNNLDFPLDLRVKNFLEAQQTTGDHHNHKKIH